MRYFLLIIMASLVLGGCYSKEVRHLASDASLIKPGISTLDDVQRYLGEPNGRREISPGTVEYVYYEDRPGVFGYTPMLQELADPVGYEMIIVTLQDEMVVNCEFRTFNESDRDWVDDFTWEEVK